MPENPEVNVMKLTMLLRSNPPFNDEEQAQMNKLTAQLSSNNQTTKAAIAILDLEYAEQNQAAGEIYVEQMITLCEAAIARRIHVIRSN